MNLQKHYWSTVCVFSKQPVFFHSRSCKVYRCPAQLTIVLQLQDLHLNDVIVSEGIWKCTNEE